jgi:hypothetical protein
MNKHIARTATVTFAVLVAVLQGTSPLAFPIVGILAYTLYRLADYGTRVTDHALDVASARRVAELTWELRTAAAAQELERRRRRASHVAPGYAPPLVARREPDLITPAYGVPLLCGVSA